MRISTLKYLSVFSLPLLAFVSFNSSGWVTFLPVLQAFFIIPVLDLFLKPDPENFSEAEEEIRKKDRLYDYLIYLVVPVQLVFVWLFLQSFHQAEPSATTIAGRISSMGLLCGVLGINVAHELGHRNKKYEQFLSKILLLTSLYMHFFIEHNRGHHKNVSTREDPSSARYGESLYAFWFRSVLYSYLSAWSLEKKTLVKKGEPVVSLANEMLRFQIIQVLFLGLIFFFFGLKIMLFYVAAAVMGILLLETVNYIEHYGLERQKSVKGYERVMPGHSWNSDHILGRIMLFELSRHSDHHFIASRKYQILRHLDESPQMPTGYPGMMVMATIPPIWYYFMNGRIKNHNKMSDLLPN